MEIKTVGVVGAGQMGHGIAHVMLRAGHRVLLLDTTENFVDAGARRISKLGMNHPMGPLELADLIGLDVCLDILKVLYESLRDPKYRPCPLLERLVAAGWLGCKTGHGFYEYPKK